MTPEQIEARIQVVKNMIAGYTISLDLHKSECAYALRKIGEYDHELDTLLDKRQPMRSANVIRRTVMGPLL